MRAFFEAYREQTRNRTQQTLISEHFEQMTYASIAILIVRSVNSSHFWVLAGRQTIEGCLLYLKFVVKTAS